MTSKELLASYKDQHSIERNFGFLKEPLIVNALFLKTERRIEAPALILFIALMVWRLMERTMRVSLKETGTKVEGWNKRPTSRSTSFMMTAKFLSVIVSKEAGGRYLPNAFTEVQRHYLALLGLSETVFVDPYAEPNPDMYRRMSVLADTG
jgi:transposase